MTAPAIHRAMATRRRRLAFATALAAAIAGVAVALPGLSAPPTSADNFESKLKSAYLVNIANFVTWPKKGDSIVLCASRSSTIAPYLQSLTDIRLGTGKKLDILINPDTLGKCDMLYWDGPSAGAGGSALLETRHRSLLIVGDRAGGNADLFAIEFYVRNLKLRFFINRAIVDKADYKVSSKLMRLSRETE